MPQSPQQRFWRAYFHEESCSTYFEYRTMGAHIFKTLPFSNRSMVLVIMPMKGFILRSQLIVPVSITCLLLKSPRQILFEKHLVFKSRD